MSFETSTTGFQMQGKDKRLGDYITNLVYRDIPVVLSLGSAFM